jgi:SHS2 domain-containing protein
VSRGGNNPHDADAGVRRYDGTPAEAFEQAAQALTEIVTTAGIKSLAVGVACEAPNLELLLVEWLNAITTKLRPAR